MRNSNYKKKQEQKNINLIKWIQKKIHTIYHITQNIQIIQAKIKYIKQNIWSEENQVNNFKIYKETENV